MIASNMWTSFVSMTKTQHAVWALTIFDVVLFVAVAFKYAQLIFGGLI